MLNSAEHQLRMKFALLINLKLLILANSFLLNIAKHEKSFITSGPESSQAGHSVDS